MNLTEFKIRQLQRRVMVQSKAVVLEVEKITADTYSGGTTYTGESFILLDIYPKTNGTVEVSYGGLTKTVTDTSGATKPNAQQVFFGTFNGVSDSVETPASGTLTIEGDCRGFGIGSFAPSKGASNRCGCITEVESFGNVEFIPANAFGSILGSCKKLTSVIIPSSVTSIGDYAFNYCSALTSVTIPSSITSVSEGTFSNCNALVSVTIPSSVTSIGDSAFYKTDWPLRTITVLSNTPATLLGDTVFDSVGKNKIVVPSGCGDTYKTAEYWSEYADYITEAS